MKSIIDQEFEKYKDAVYPDGMQKDQESQVTQAFYAGALSNIICTGLKLQEIQTEIAESLKPFLIKPKE